MMVWEYIEELYKINLRAGYVEDTTEMVARYLNGLRFDIQDEHGMVNPTGIDKAYQYALRAENYCKGNISLKGDLVREAKVNSVVARLPPHERG